MIPTTQIIFPIKARVIVMAAMTLNMRAEEVQVGIYLVYSFKQECYPHMYT